MRITLVTEGTYPTQLGGVSVWCDQLIRGLSHHEFHVRSLIGGESERSVWDVPDNVRELSMIALWGQEPHSRTRPSRRSFEDFGPIHQDFLDALLSVEDAPIGRFLDSLRALHWFQQVADLGAALRTEASLRRLVASWQAVSRLAGRAWRTTTPTLADALVASQLLEHFLRALAVSPPPGADVCHCVSNGLGSLVAMAGKWSHGTPFILTEHGVYLREQYLGYAHSSFSPPVRSIALRFLRLLTSGAYALADLIAPGSHYNQRWELRGGADPARIRPVYNGVEPSEFPPAAAEAAVPTLCWVGRVDPLKDVETLIRAFALIRERLPLARLRMFGSVPSGNETYRDRCVQLLHELALVDSAVFEGRVPSVVDGYHSGHVVVLSSISEGFPYTVIEAMISGRATVSTDVGGVSEAVGDAGLIVPARDHVAMADACLRLLCDDELRQRLGQAARQRVLESFTLTKFLRTYETLYREVAAMRRPPDVTAPRAWEAA